MKNSVGNRLVLEVGIGVLFFSTNLLIAQLLTTHVSLSQHYIYPIILLELNRQWDKYGLEQKNSNLIFIQIHYLSGTDLIQK